MSDPTLPGFASERVAYQMQSWSHADACTCGISSIANGHERQCPYPTTPHFWAPMEDGAARTRWMPKRDARVAVDQAASWAGAIYGVSIPAMQVVELPSGRVIWRDSHQYPAAGAPIAPVWQDEVYAAARADCTADQPTDRGTPNVGMTQGVLF